jgi:hypothetical protein
MARGLSRLIRTAKNPPDPLSALIDEYLIKRKYEPDPLPPTKSRRRRGGRFTPSGMKCMRAACFQFMQVEAHVATTPEQELVFGVGNWTHHMWQAYFKDMERILGPEQFQFFGHEVWCSVPKFYLAGNLDVHCAINGNPAIIDIKTINDAGFSQLHFKGQADPEHVDQLTRYLRAQDVPLGLLMYVNKNDQRYKIFVVRYDKRRWLKSVEWLRAGIRHLAEQTVPDMHEDCTADSSMRRYCKYATYCYGDDDLDLQALLYSGQKSFRELWEETSAPDLSGGTG